MVTLGIDSVIQGCQIYNGSIKRGAAMCSSCLQPLFEMLKRVRIGVKGGRGEGSTAKMPGQWA